MNEPDFRPRVALTMGDVAGIGPEVIVRACSDGSIADWCRPIVVGHPAVLQRAVDLVAAPLHVVSIDEITDAVPESRQLLCWNPSGDSAADVVPGQLDARAGRAAYDYLIGAARATLDGAVDAIVTAPLNKAALHLAGLKYPGHTEILADVCGVTEFGMMLYLPRGSAVRSANGLGVVHTTLHTSIKSVPDLLSTELIAEKIHLIDGFMSDVGCPKPRVAVCALNPHAGEDGLFGDEESRIIAPAVAAARTRGIDVTGPLPADTLLLRAVSGEFDAVVAMYHDQGHIALKLIGFDRAVNVTLGLPIVRTSPSHGTAFDIAWTGQADASGFIEALRIATLLARTKRSASKASSSKASSSKASSGKASSGKASSGKAALQQ